MHFISWPDNVTKTDETVRPPPAPAHQKLADVSGLRRAATQCDRMIILR